MPRQPTGHPSISSGVMPRADVLANSDMTSGSSNGISLASKTCSFPSYSFSIASELMSSSSVLIMVGSSCPRISSFKQVVVDGMIVKVGCDNVRRHIVGRMLYRSKGVDILTVGKNNDSSRVLPRTSADSSTSLHDPVNFAIPLSASPFLIIILHKSKRPSYLPGFRWSRHGRSALSKITSVYLCALL